MRHLAMSFLLVGCDHPNCYSPDRNLDRAYEEGAVGCSCDESEPDVCAQDDTDPDRVRDVALTCEEGAWVAVQDGACMLQR